MGIDRRELILARLFAVLQSVTVDGIDIKACVRVRDQLTDDMRPGILLLDADEEARPDADHRGRAAASPNRVELKPEIYIAMDSRKPQNESTGTDLNKFRAAVLKAVLTDVDLAGLAGGSDNLFYMGLVSDLARGRAMEGEMGLMIIITYPFRPKEL